MIYILAATVGAGAIGIGWTIGLYNTIQTAQNDYKGQWADIKTEYQRKIDLFLNLAKTVKSHATFEKETLIQLTKARSGLTDSKNINNVEIQKMESLFAGFKLQMEAYPDLKSHTHYSKLMDEVSRTEERILSARAELNNIAEDFNTMIDMFPNNIVCKWLFAADHLDYFKEGIKVEDSVELDI